MVLNEMTPEGHIINDLTIGEYDVVIASAPARDTVRRSTVAEALNLRQVGVAIPDDAIVSTRIFQRKRSWQNAFACYWSGTTNPRAGRSYGHAAADGYSEVAA